MNKADVTKELRRELDMRAQKYPEWIANDKLNRNIAERRYRRLRYAVEVLEGMTDKELREFHNRYLERNQLEEQRRNAQQSLF